MKLKAHVGREKGVQKRTKRLKEGKKQSIADKEDKDVKTGDCRRRGWILLN